MNLLKHRAHLLNIQLVRMSSSVLLQLLPVPRQNIEFGDDIKEGAPGAFGPGQVGVQLVLAPQLPSPRNMVCLQGQAKSKDISNSQIRTCQVPGK